MRGASAAADARVLGGRYRLLGQVGRGGMAEVHRARDDVLDREVAVKLLRDGAGSPEDTARFDSEARILARLSHPGLVALLDAGVSDGGPFLVLELVRGTTLAQRCCTAPLSVAETRAIGRKLAAALGYVHARGVVHRDVKPSNVLLAADGRVCLADFGIARLLGDRQPPGPGQPTVGTAAYLSPEQVLDDEVTSASDVWSLGLVLVEALTGRRAYPGALAEAALARLTRPPEVPRSAPEPLRGLLRRMTAREPARRPTAGQVVAALADGRPGAGVGGVALLASPALARPVRSATRITVAACAAAVTGLVATGLLPAGGHTAAPGPQAPSGATAPGVGGTGAGSTGGAAEERPAGRDRAAAHRRAGPVRTVASPQGGEPGSR